MRAIPIPDDNAASTAGDTLQSIPISAKNGAATSGAIPVARNPMPPKMVSIDIIVTPRGLCFCYCMLVSVYRHIYSMGSTEELGQDAIDNF
jgi:hypothetical protein